MFGSHIYKNGSIVKSIKEEIKDIFNKTSFRIGAVAIFIGGPRDRKIKITQQEIEELKQFITESKIKVIAHSSYSSYPWKGDPDASRYIREELLICQEAGICGLVIHLPKLPIERVMRYIKRLIIPNINVLLYLETPAVTGESYYETPYKINDLFQNIKLVDPELKYFGLCIDTAHLWTCGVNISSYENANDWLYELEQYNISCKMIVHLNDSGKRLGEGPDSHAGLLNGHIWKSYKKKINQSGLTAFVDFVKKNNLICILERKPHEIVYLDYLELKKIV
jgi:endonuclease IV